MKLNELMRDFGAWLGVADVPADVDGTYQLDVGGLPIMLFERDGQLTMLATLGRLPQEGAGTLGWQMMEAMYMDEGSDGATFSVDYEEECFCLQRRDPLAETDVDGFIARFNGFAATAEKWRRLIADSQFAQQATD